MVKLKIRHKTLICSGRRPGTAWRTYKLCKLTATASRPALPGRGRIFQLSPRLSFAPPRSDGRFVRGFRTARGGNPKPWGSRANGMFSSLSIATLEGREVEGTDGEGGRWQGLSLCVFFLFSLHNSPCSCALCRNPSTAPLPTSSSVTPRPRGSCPVGQESRSCGSNHGAVISVGKSLRNCSWYRHHACSVPPRCTTPPSTRRARVAAGSGGAGLHLPVPKQPRCWAGTSGHPPGSGGAFWSREVSAGPLAQPCMMFISTCPGKGLLESAAEFCGLSVGLSVHQPRFPNARRAGF